MVGYIIAGAVILLAAVMLIRTFRMKPATGEKAPAWQPPETVDPACERLARAIRCRTVSSSEGPVDLTPFRELHDALEDMYPLVHSHLERKVVNGGSLLYHWKGQDPEAKPVLFMGHLDVVPVEKGTEADWEHDAFAGVIEDGYVWGRGAMDIKIQVIALLDAAERLLREGFTPRADIYFAFGHDEEPGGREGAAKVAELLRQRGVRFEFLMDEGGCITYGALPGVSEPTAVVGTCEKGYVNVEMIAQGEGGHASQPPAHTALGILARAAARLEGKPFPRRLTPPARLMLTYAGPHMGFVSRLAIANLWLMAPVVKKVFGSSATGNALLRTTMAVTMAQGAPEPNILPQTARMIVNVRIAPGMTGADVLRYMEKVIRDPRVTLKLCRLDEPSKVSSVDSRAFQLIKEGVAVVCPDAFVMPYMMVAGTDVPKYEDLAEDCYRFTPFTAHSADLERIHGTNERISTLDVARCVAFYTHIMQRV
jgi:carboxypeptidase PM20D1